MRYVSSLLVVFWAVIKDELRMGEDGRESSCLCYASR